MRSFVIVFTFLRFTSLVCGAPRGIITRDLNLRSNSLGPRTGKLVDVQLKYCLIRFQAPKDGLDPKMTVNNWKPLGSPENTPQEVASTINNFGNKDHINIALWLYGTSWSMAYADVDPGPFVDGLDPLESQLGLNGKNVVVSIILPSGMDKLAIVSVPESDIQMNRHMHNRAVGIKLKQKTNPLKAEDFAYRTSEVLKNAILGARQKAPTVPAVYGFPVGNYRFIMEEPRGGYKPSTKMNSVAYARIAEYHAKEEKKKQQKIAEEKKDGEKDEKKLGT